jgi:hypothetical protein
MMLTVRELIAMLPVTEAEAADMEVRIGDVAEADDLHCSVGRVVKRAGCIVLVPGDDDVWKDETLSSTILMEHLWTAKKEDDIED